MEASMPGKRTHPKQETPPVGLRRPRAAGGLVAALERLRVNKPPSFDWKGDYAAAPSIPATPAASKAPKCGVSPPPISAGNSDDRAPGPAAPFPGHCKNLLYSRGDAENAEESLKNLRALRVSA
jgi:hypothetical protein